MAYLPEGLVLEAARHAGVPYAWGGVDLTTGVDCSGYVLAVFERRGLDFPDGVRTAEQIRQVCLPVADADVQPGDLIFLTGTYQTADPATHVAISLGVGSRRAWSAVDEGVKESVLGDWWQAHWLEARRHPGVGATLLPTTPELVHPFATLYPTIQTYASLYDVDPRIVTALAYQESGFRNFRVHADGTGHGLFGLDDSGGLIEFEQWSGSSFGRGADAGMIPPVLQIEFVCSWFERNLPRYGDTLTACQAWHRGPSLYRDAAGWSYRSLIETHVRRLFGA
jgi:hypothetical protein